MRLKALVGAKIKAKRVCKGIRSFYLRCKRNRSRNEEGCRFCGSQSCNSWLVREGYWIEEWKRCLDCGAVYANEMYGGVYGVCT